MPPTLLTFAPMIDSEAARLLLAWYGVEYRERNRLFGWVSLLTLLHGGFGRIPLLYGDGKAMSEPRDIVRRFDAEAGARRLVPVDPDLQKQVEDAWKRFNWTVGWDTAGLAYHHLLPRSALMRASWGAPISALGRATLPLSYPLLAWLFTSGLKLNDANAAAMLERVRRMLDEVDDVLADGRRFIGGDMMTLADIGLATACAPIVVPPHYARQLPPIDALPIPLRDLIAETRARPVAKLVARVYAACLQEKSS